MRAGIRGGAGQTGAGRNFRRAGPDGSWLHVLRLDRKIEGATLPFDFVRPRIAEYLGETRGRHAIAGAIAQLAQQAKIEGVVLAPDEASEPRSAP